MEASAIQFQIKELDRRISGLHKTAGGLSTDVGQNKTDIEVLKRDRLEDRADIEEIKKAIAEQGEKNRRALQESDEKFRDALKASDAKYKAAQEKSDAKARANSNRVIATLLAFTLTTAGSAISLALSMGAHP